MKVLMCRVGEEARIEDIGEGLEAMQNAVDGYIQAIYPYDELVAMVVNEEGKLMGLPYNRFLVNDNGEIVDIICGDFFICGIDDYDFTDIQDEYIDKFITKMNETNLATCKPMFKIKRL